MLYLAAIDDAELVHATKSTTNPAPLCGQPHGRSRLVKVSHSTFNKDTSTSSTQTVTVEIHTAADVTCPICAIALAPKKIRPLTLAQPPEIPEGQAEVKPAPRTRRRARSTSKS